MLLDVLAKRSYGAFFSTNSSFEFFIELHEAISLAVVEGIEHGFGQIGKGVERELHFMLKVRVLRALIRHT